MSFARAPRPPPEPEADTVELPPPTLKTLYRRAAIAPAPLTSRQPTPSVPRGSSK